VDEDVEEPKSGRKCYADDCTNEPMWCGLCASHCMGDEYHTPTEDAFKD
jgi:hypothetical protein